MQIVANSLQRHSHITSNVLYLNLTTIFRIGRLYKHCLRVASPRGPGFYPGIFFRGVNLTQGSHTGEARRAESGHVVLGEGGSQLGSAPQWGLNLDFLHNWDPQNAACDGPEAATHPLA